MVSRVARVVDLLEIEIRELLQDLVGHPVVFLQGAEGVLFLDEIDADGLRPAQLADTG